MKTTITESEFIEKEISQIPSKRLCLLDIDRVKKNLSIIHREHTKKTNDIEFAKNFQKNCPTANGITEDYLYKIVRIEDVTLWLSLRFWNRDVAYPYVDILYYSCRLSELKEKIKFIYSEILVQYSNIDIQNVRLTCYETDFDLLREMDVVEDNLLLGKWIEQKVDRSWNHKDISIERLSELTAEDYARYAIEYNLFNVEHPNLHFVRAESFESLKERITDGMVYKIYRNADFIGLFAFVKDDFFQAYYGYWVYDKMIFKDYRGNNYAYIAQTLIEKDIARANPSRHQVILGTISPQNISSLKSAIQSGRRVWMKQVMIKPLK